MNFPANDHVFNPTSSSSSTPPNTFNQQPPYNVQYQHPHHHHPYMYPQMQQLQMQQLHQQYYPQYQPYYAYPQPPIQPYHPTMHSQSPMLHSQAPMLRPPAPSPHPGPAFHQGFQAPVLNQPTPPPSPVTQKEAIPNEQMNHSKRNTSRANDRKYKNKGNRQKDSFPTYRVPSLKTPEDIEKWIEQRKKNYPTDSNIEKKKQLQEEEIAKQSQIRKEIMNKKTKGKDVVNEQQPDEDSDSSAIPEEQTCKLPPKRKRGVCKYFVRGKCRHGQECLFSHEKPIKKHQAIEQKDQFLKSRPTLLKQLLSNDIGKENHAILQCFEFLVKKYHLDHE